MVAPAGSLLRIIYPIKINELTYHILPLIEVEIQCLHIVLSLGFIASNP